MTSVYMLSLSALVELDDQPLHPLGGGLLLPLVHGPGPRDRQRVGVVEHGVEIRRLPRDLLEVLAEAAPRDGVDLPFQDRRLVLLGGVPAQEELVPLVEDVRQEFEQARPIRLAHLVDGLWLFVPLLHLGGEGRPEHSDDHVADRGGDLADPEVDRDVVPGGQGSDEGDRVGDLLVFEEVLLVGHEREPVLDHDAAGATGPLEFIPIGPPLDGSHLHRPQADGLDEVLDIGHGDEGDRDRPRRKSRGQEEQDAERFVPIDPLQVVDIPELAGDEVGQLRASGGLEGPVDVDQEPLDAARRSRWRSG